MLTYEEAGQGVPVVLIHAFPLSRAMWKGEIGRFSGTARVIAPDLPGFGESARQGKPSLPQMAREVGDLLDRLEVREPVMFAGLSMGGYVAFEFIRQFPERVRGLGLFSARAGADTPEGREGRLKAVEKIRGGGLAPFAKTILPKLLGKTTLGSKPDLVKQVSRMIEAGDPAGVADALLAMADRRDSTDLSASIRCPTWVIAGEEDSFIPVSEAEGLAAKISGARLEVIPKAGHLVNMEQPEVFQGILERFLKSR